MVSDAFSLFPDSLPRDRPLIRLTILARAVDLGLFKKDRLKQLRSAINTELSQYIASGNVPSFRKRTEEIRHHTERIGELALLSELPLDKDSRQSIGHAIVEERNALSDAYLAYVDHILEGLRPQARVRYHLGRNPSTSIPFLAAKMHRFPSESDPSLCLTTSTRWSWTTPALTLQPCPSVRTSMSRYAPASLTRSSETSFPEFFLAHPTNILRACSLASSLVLALLARRYDPLMRLFS